MHSRRWRSTEPAAASHAPSPLGAESTPPFRIRHRGAGVESSSLPSNHSGSNPARCAFPSVRPHSAPQQNHQIALTRLNVECGLVEHHLHMISPDLGKPGLDATATEPLSDSKRGVLVPPDALDDSNRARLIEDSTDAGVLGGLSHRIDHQPRVAPWPSLKSSTRCSTCEMPTRTGMLSLIVTVPRLHYCPRARRWADADNDHRSGESIHKPAPGFLS